MARFDRNTQPVGFVFKLLHKTHHPLRNGSEVMVIELLAFGRTVTQQGPARLLQVGAGLEKSVVHKEVLLFPAQSGCDLIDVLVKVFTDIRSCLIHHLKCSEQRCFVVQRLPCIGHENGWDAQGRTHDEGGRSRIPCGVSAGLESVSDPSVRE